MAVGECEKPFEAGGPTTGVPAAPAPAVGGAERARLPDHAVGGHRRSSTHAPWRLVRVSVTIVTHDSGLVFSRCLDSLAVQTLAPTEVIVVDNGSRDESRGIARTHPVVAASEALATNRGFAAAQNRAIDRSHGEWVLVLNPDTVLTPTFVETLAARTAAPPDLRLGSLCGKLLRLHRETLRPVDPPMIDSTGIVFTRTFRHYDRGSQRTDRGQWNREEEVFGPSAAAALYRREMIEDVRVDGQFFDEAFFAYREDADVAWRARLLGWSCRYVPSAVGYHVRRVTVGAPRASLPAVVNRHSVKNRFLMRIKNIDGAVARRCGWRGLARDAVVIGGCLLWEWRSAPALWQALALARRAWRHRREIQSRRRRHGDEIAKWFA